jgi:hypothetical protein
MSFKALLRGAAFAAVALTLLGASASSQQPKTTVMPKLEPVAETRLIMEGLAHPNFRGAAKILKEKPADVQSWTFARGQALLIAETANLLMLRPPKNQGQALWFERVMDLRKSATDLAAAAGNRDYSASKAGVINVANRCNRCHQSFRANVEIVPFDDGPAPPPEKTE